MNKPTFYIVAGEASGDILGARLMAALKHHYPDAIFKGIGGSLMQSEGLSSYYPMDRLSVMGIVPILKRMPELLSMRRRLAKTILSEKPDCFIGIDAPEFNTHLEFQLKKAGIKTVHYVSPSVWAWREKRIHKIAQSVSLMLCLFPFELKIYKQHKVPAVCIGHPLANEIPIEPDIQAARKALNLPLDKKMIAVLPGSRSTEVHYLIDDFIQTIEKISDQNSDIYFVIPCANDKRKKQIEQSLSNYPNIINVQLIDGQSRMVMQASDYILLASGTATLEAMLMKKPMVVAYKMSAFTLWVFRKLIKIKLFSLPNLLAGKSIVKELIQEDCTVDNLYNEMDKLIQAGENKPLVEQFKTIHQSLQIGGSEKAANSIVDLLNGKYDNAI
ncbi:MAG: lipid-A-disaccharide synthase [Gammaproteobacteria bacterium]|nr:lipid-A-disaccharide synthase [Gammaproteobacteria bacterium]MDH5628522.1 lipid-A-disaccharide synthase [Gammaproteobacteria bacterium]